MTELTNLTPCTQYTMEIVAGPHVHGKQQDVSAEYNNNEEEKKLLEETINKLWTADDTDFRAYAKTSPVSYLYISFIIRLLVLVTDYLWEANQEGNLVNIWHFKYLSIFI